MADIDTPSTYVHRAIPRSQIEAISAKAKDRAKMLTKSAIEGYLRSFLDTTGGNRSYTKIVSNSMLTFITDRSVSPADANNPKVKETQLTRLYHEVKEKTPAILIVDTSLEWTPNSLGSIDNARIVRDVEGKARWIGRFHITAKVGVTIAVVTNDQDTTDQLITFMCLVLTQIRNMAGGSRLHSMEPGDAWEVRIPLNYNATNTNSINIGQDTKDSKWAASIDLPLDFEDSFLLEQDFIEYDTDDVRNGMLISDCNNPNAADLPPIITAPSTIQLNTPTTIFIYRMRPQHRVVIDRPNLCTFSEVQPGVYNITPRALGTFNFQVVDETRPQGDGTMLSPSVSAAKVITIVI